MNNFRNGGCSESNGSECATDNHRNNENIDLSRTAGNMDAIFSEEVMNSLSPISIGNYDAGNITNTDVRKDREEISSVLRDTSKYASNNTRGIRGVGGIGPVNSDQAVTSTAGSPTNTGVMTTWSGVDAQNSVILNDVNNSSANSKMNVNMNLILNPNMNTKISDTSNMNTNMYMNLSMNMNSNIIDNNNNNVINTNPNLNLKSNHNSVQSFQDSSKLGSTLPATGAGNNLIGNGGAMTDGVNIGSTAIKGNPSPASIKAGELVSLSSRSRQYSGQLDDCRSNLDANNQDLSKASSEHMIQMLFGQASNFGKDNMILQSDVCGDSQLRISAISKQRKKKRRAKNDFLRNLNGFGAEGGKSGSCAIGNLSSPDSNQPRRKSEPAFNMFADILGDPPNYGRGEDDQAHRNRDGVRATRGSSLTIHTLMGDWAGAMTDSSHLDNNTAVNSSDVTKDRWNKSNAADGWSSPSDSPGPHAGHVVDQSLNRRAAMQGLRSNSEPLFSDLMYDALNDLEPESVFDEKRGGSARLQQQYRQDPMVNGGKGGVSSDLMTFFSSSSFTEGTDQKTPLSHFPSEKKLSKSEGSSESLPATSPSATTVATKGLPMTSIASQATPAQTCNANDALNDMQHSSQRRDDQNEDTFTNIFVDDFGNQRKPRRRTKCSTDYPQNQHKRENIRQLGKSVKRSRSVDPVEMFSTLGNALFEESNNDDGDYPFCFRSGPYIDQPISGLPTEEQQQIDCKGMFNRAKPKRRRSAPLLSQEVLGGLDFDAENKSEGQPNNPFDFFTFPTSLGDASKMPSTTNNRPLPASNSGVGPLRVEADQNTSMKSQSGTRHGNHNEPSKMAINDTDSSASKFLCEQQRNNLNFIQLMFDGNNSRNSLIPTNQEAENSDVGNLVIGPENSNSMTQTFPKSNTRISTTGYQPQSLPSTQTVQANSNSIDKVVNLRHNMITNKGNSSLINYGKSPGGIRSNLPFASGSQNIEKSVIGSMSLSQKMPSSAGGVDELKILSVVKDTQNSLKTLHPIVIQSGDTFAMEEIAKAFELTALSSKFLLSGTPSDLTNACIAVNEAQANINKLQDRLRASASVRIQTFPSSCNASGSGSDRRSHNGTNSGGTVAGMRESFHCGSDNMTGYSGSSGSPMGPVALSGEVPCGKGNGGASSGTGTLVDAVSHVGTSDPRDGCPSVFTAATHVSAAGTRGTKNLKNKILSDNGNASNPLTSSPHTALEKMPLTNITVLRQKVGKGGGIPYISQSVSPLPLNSNSDNVGQTNQASIVNVVRRDSSASSSTPIICTMASPCGPVSPEKSPLISSTILNSQFNSLPLPPTLQADASKNLSAPAKCEASSSAESLSQKRIIVASHLNPWIGKTQAQILNKKTESVKSYLQTMGNNNQSHKQSQKGLTENDESKETIATKKAKDKEDEF